MSIKSFAFWPQQHLLFYLQIDVFCDHIQRKKSLITFFFSLSLSLPLFGGNNLTKLNKKPLQSKQNITFCSAHHFHFSFSSVTVRGFQEHSPLHTIAGTSETRLGAFLYFGQLFKAWAIIILPKSPTHFRQFFVKVSKSFILLKKSFLGNFYRHLATFYWSHWSEPENVNILRKRMYLPTTVWRVPSLTGLNSTKQENLLLFVNV